MRFSDIMIRRRAINHFDPDRDVSEDQLRSILESAVKAPSSFNLQPWKVVVVRDADRKAALRALAFDQPKITDAPVILMILADREGWKEGADNWERQLSENFPPEQREWFTNSTAGLYGSSPDAIQAFANKNAGLFAMSLMYAASDEGLHTHPMDGFDHEAVRREFAIPDRYWIPMLIAVGHAKPGLEVHPKGWRQTYEEMVLDRH